MQSKSERKTTPIVDQIGQINFEGNILPHDWYRHEILRHESGKPNTIAIILLSDIIYWYRPSPLRDEATGQVIGTYRKFAADKLQKSNQSWADQFGFTKRQVKDAVAFLVHRELVRIELRHFPVMGVMLHNVRFIEPVVKNIKAATFGEPIIVDGHLYDVVRTNKEVEEMDVLKAIQGDEEMDVITSDSLHSNVSTSTFESPTYTENTTEITTKTTIIKIPAFSKIRAESESNTSFDASSSDGDTSSQFTSDSFSKISQEEPFLPLDKKSVKPQQPATRGPATKQKKVYHWKDFDIRELYNLMEEYLSWHPCDWMTCPRSLAQHF